jgi:response regulator RpfG family c-di-GMP phosphodiesterase
MSESVEIIQARPALRVLIVEDNHRDVKLTVAVLERSGYHLTFNIVDSLKSFQEQLDAAQHEIIISDYNLRDWTAVDVLEIVKKSGKDIPVVVVSGSLGDESAVELIKKGATDYVLKDRLARLPSAIQRALEEKSLREERQRAEEQINLQVNRLAALRAIDIAITSTLDIRVTLSVFLDQVTTQLGVHAANILLLKPHTQMLEYFTGRGFKSAHGVRSQLHLRENPASHAALERRIVSIPDLKASRGLLADSPILADEHFVSYLAAPLIAKGQVNGVLEMWHREPLEPSPDWFEFLEALTGQAAIAIDNAALYQELQASNANLLLAYDTTLEGWVKAIDMRDKETEGHTRRVTELTIRLAYEYPLPEEQIVHIRRGALLHDIGKMAIPDAILKKPGPLTPEEWEIMRLHPVYAYEWLSPIAYLHPALDIPFCHHEKWDGTGYPRGLKGEEIPLQARLFSVVDVWDALRSDRPYRDGWTEEKVCAYIQERAGRDFDPHVVEIFLNTVKQHRCNLVGSACQT